MSAEYAILKDVGEHEMELDVTHKGLTLSEALVIYKADSDIYITIWNPEELINI